MNSHHQSLANFFVILRLYGPTKPFFDQSWKPGDLEKFK